MQNLKRKPKTHLNLINKLHIKSLDSMIKCNIKCEVNSENNALNLLDSLIL